MLLEITAFIGVATFALFFLAETKGKAILGVFGALVLITFALFLYVDGIQTIESQTRLTNETQIYAFINATNETNVTVFRNETLNNVYTNVGFYINNKDLVTLTMIGTAAFLLFHYGFNITKG